MENIKSNMLDSILGSFSNSPLLLAILLILIFTFYVLKTEKLKPEVKETFVKMVKTILYILTVTTCAVYLIDMISKVFK